MKIYYQIFKNPSAQFLIGGTEQGVCFLEIGSSETYLCKRLKEEFPESELTKKSANEVPLDVWAESVQSYLAGGSSDLSKIPLDISGTDFQRKVWGHLRKIPTGDTQSYANVAKRLNHPTAARAVANACAANKIALLIPCHRVVRRDGSLGGFRWGLEMKESLLALEKIQTV